MNSTPKNSAPSLAAVRCLIVALTRNVACVDDVEKAGPHDLDLDPLRERKTQAGGFGEIVHASVIGFSGPFSSAQASSARQ